MIVVDLRNDSVGANSTSMYERYANSVRVSHLARNDTHFKYDQSAELLTGTRSKSENWM